MEKKISKAILEKQEVVSKIKGQIQDSKSVVIINYGGLTVAQDTELRNEFRKNNVEYKVYKNTLIERALNDLGYDQFGEILKSTTSVAFGKDEVAAAKIIADNSKKLAGKISFKAGIVDGKFADAKELAMLASIPSRDVLIAKIVGCMASSIIKFVCVINAIKQAKEQ